MKEVIGQCLNLIQNDPYTKMSGDYILISVGYGRNSLDHHVTNALYCLHKLQDAQKFIDAMNNPSEINNADYIEDSLTGRISTDTLTEDKAIEYCRCIAWNVVEVFEQDLAALMLRKVNHWKTIEIGSLVSEGDDDDD